MIFLNLQQEWEAWLAPVYKQIRTTKSQLTRCTTLATDVTQHTALQNKSNVCSGSRVTNSTVMKLHGSVNWGGIIVKTYKEHLLTFIFCTLC